MVGRVGGGDADDHGRRAGGGGAHGVDGGLAVAGPVLLVDDEEVEAGDRRHLGEGGLRTLQPGAERLLSGGEARLEAVGAVHVGKAP